MCTAFNTGFKTAIKIVSNTGISAEVTEDSTRQSAPDMRYNQHD